MKQKFKIIFLLTLNNVNLNARITDSSKEFKIISSKDEDRTKVNILLKVEHQANRNML